MDGTFDVIRKYISSWGPHVEHSLQHLRPALYWQGNIVRGIVVQLPNLLHGSVLKVKYRDCHGSARHAAGGGLNEDTTKKDFDESASPSGTQTELVAARDIPWDDVSTKLDVVVHPVSATFESQIMCPRSALSHQGGAHDTTGIIHLKPTVVVHPGLATYNVDDDNNNRMQHGELGHDNDSHGTAVTAEPSMTTYNDSSTIQVDARDTSDDIHLKPSLVVHPDLAKVNFGDDGSIITQRIVLSEQECPVDTLARTQLLAELSATMNYDSHGTAATAEPSATTTNNDSNTATHRTFSLSLMDVLQCFAMFCYALWH